MTQGRTRALDHLFVFVADEGRARRMMDAANLRGSLDPALPFVFGAPGGAPAIDCDPAMALVARAFPAIAVRRGTPRLTMSLLVRGGTVGREIDWPLDPPS